MAKKRQQDFTKVQLKPGRLLSRRANITSTKFKAKKILMPKEKIIKKKSEFTIEHCIRKIKSVSSDKDKIGFLNELNRLIHRQSDSLNAYLHKIFETVLDYIRDPHDVIRHAALKVIISVLDVTDDLQLHNFADLLNNTISAIMKNPNPKIAPISLMLLDSMLKNHPELICHNITILYDLLPTERKHYTRKNMSEKECLHQYSERGDINALGHINAFLKNVLLLKNKNDLAQNEEEEEKIVDMDVTKTMSLILYTRGGLQPVNIEEAYSKQFNPQTDPFDEVEKLTPLIDALLKLIPSYFCQIIGSESNADDNVFKNEALTSLSILMQLLCNVAEIAEKISYTNAAEEITVFLKERVFSSHRKRFPFELYAFLPGTGNLLPLALLNTSLCFLYMKFLSSNENCEDDGELIENYLKKFFSFEKTYSSDIKCQCIPFFIKIIHLSSYRTEVPEVIYFLLKHLVLLLKTRINHPNKKMLLNLLFNMSLRPEYKFWVESKPMELWYEWLLGHLKEKENTKLDKKMIRMICKIGKLRHSSFIKHLDFNVLKFLLKSRSDDIRESAILLLHNMDLDHELLKNIYDIISLDSFPKKFTITVIRMISVRFYQYPGNVRPYVDYIEFLLNIAIDVCNFFRSRMIDLEANQYTKAVQMIQNGHPYCIVPSIHWKEHSKVFEICQKYLRNLPLAPVGVMFMKIVQQLLPDKDNPPVVIPIHCALALLKLDMPEFKEKSHLSRMRNLHFSCLLTTSVLTQTSMDDEWYKWNVCELMDSISLTSNLALNILRLLEQGKFCKGEPDGLVVYHILRMLKVFVERRMLDYECANTVELVLQIISSLVEDQCCDKTMKHQPLYVALYNFFINHFCE